MSTICALNCVPGGSVFLLSLPRGVPSSAFGTSPLPPSQCTNTPNGSHLSTVASITSPTRGRLRLLLADPAQRNAPLGIVDRLDLHPDRLSLFHHLARMLHVAVRERGDVHQAIHAREQLDECAERLQPRDLALQPRALLELRPGGVPRILLEGAQRQRDLLMQLVI